MALISGGSGLKKSKSPRPRQGLWLFLKWSPIIF